MKPKLLLRLAALLAVLTVGTTANAQIWVGQTLGSPSIAGSLTTNTDGTLTVVAGGDDIWNTSDNGYYYFTWVTGDFDARVRVVSLETTSSVWAKTEMMVRFSESAAGPRGSDGFLGAMCAAAQSPSNQEQYRPERSAGAANNLPGGVNVALNFPNNWLRVTRTNTTIAMWAGTDGVNWTRLANPVDTSSTANGFGAPTWPDLVSVGVAVTAHNDGTTTTTVVGQPSITTSGSVLSAPTAVGDGRDVVNSSPHSGGEASFTFVATNNSTPVALPMSYQWYKNGAAVPGATGTGFTWLATAADSGTQVKCVSWPSLFPSMTVTSSVGSLTVSSQTVSATNALKLEIFAGASRNSVEIGNVGPGDTGNYSAPGKLRWLSAAEDPGGWGDHTSRRVSGWFIPWATDKYTFYIAGDDDTDLFLSTDATPANKTIIAQELAWGAYRAYTNDQGQGPDITDPTNHFYIDQKSSDTWTNGTGTAPNATGIALEQGKLYYFEVVEHNGTGGDGIAVYAKLFTAAPPTNGTPSSLRSESNNIVMATWPQPTTLSFAPPGGIQPTNETVYEGGTAYFYARASTDAEVQPQYQWQAYGTNLPGLTRTAISFSSVIAAQNNTPLSCVATVPLIGSVTSSVAILTVNTAVFEPGFVKYTRWNNTQDQAGADNGTLGVPSLLGALGGFNASEANFVYINQFSGLFVPTNSGNFVFFTSGDNETHLFLSTDSNPANKRMIAQENSWSNPEEWTSDSGDANVTTQKRSDQWTNQASANVPPYAAGIPLVAGNKYYIEMSHREDGGGGDHMDACYKLVGQPDPVNGSASSLNIQANVIGINAPRANWVMFTLQPTNPPPVAAGAASSASFYAFGTTDSQLAVAVQDPRGGYNNNNTAPYSLIITNQFVFFQWSRNGTDIPGATGSQLTLTGLRPGDNNAQFACKMRSLGYGLAPNTHYFSNSAIATLTVTNDPTVPQLLAAGAYQNTRDGKYYVSLTFNVPIDPFTATNPASYTVSGGATVYNVAWFSADNRRILLEVSFLNPPVTVSITGLKSWSSVDLPPVSNAATYELASSMSYRDIGAGDTTTFQITDPLLPSKLWVEGPNAWTIAATGHDIWDNADGFTFLYETKTGDFDVVLRQTQYGTSSPWAKCGLMLREGVPPGTIDDFATAGAEAGRSRNWAVVNDPRDVPVTGGTGAYDVECGYRYASTNVGSGVWWPSPTNRLVRYSPQYPHAWLRLKRAAQVLTAFAGNDGTNWWKIAETTVTSNTNNPTPLPDAVFVGVCATAHNNPSGDPAAFVNNQQYYNYASVDSYTSSYTGGSIIGAPGAVLSATHQAGNITFNWTSPGTVELQWSTNLTTWNSFAPHATIPPVTVPTTGSYVFYRIHPYMNPGG